MLKCRQLTAFWHPDVVVLDLLLPHMDGYAVCKALKNNSETAALPIVILTARGEPNDRIKGLEIGADDYLTKPFNLRHPNAMDLTTFWWTQNDSKFVAR